MKGAVFFCHGYGDTCTFFFEGLPFYLLYAHIDSPVTFRV